MSTNKTISIYEAMTLLDSAEESKRFLRDLCTTEELEEMSKRWQAAQLLDQGQSYRQVAQATKLSTTTVTRVASWLKRGRKGYRLILDKI